MLFGRLLCDRHRIFQRAGTTAEDEALAKGMEEKSKEFAEKGAEVYINA